MQEWITIFRPHLFQWTMLFFQYLKDLIFRDWFKFNIVSTIVCNKNNPLLFIVPLNTYLNAKIIFALHKSIYAQIYFTHTN